jgi:hypothetical protein
MAFYSAMGSPGAMGGLGGMGGIPAASPFASTGMDPVTLAMLLRMQYGQSGGGVGPNGSMGPIMPAPPQVTGPQFHVAPQMPGMGGASGGAPNLPTGAAGAPGQSPLAGMSPQTLQSLMAMLRGGGSGGGLANNGPFAGLLNSAPTTP